MTTSRNNRINTPIALTDMRYVWDTQNRLLAASSNGYVSTYLYDGDGQRALKQHGGNEAVYTNGTQAALRSEPSQYTLYANPSFVMTDGERYTKHIYIGGERVAVRVAKLGANSSYIGNFGQESHAGNGLLPQGFSYSQLRQAQEGGVAACYDSLGYDFNPVVHRDTMDIVMIPTDGEEGEDRGLNPNIEWQRDYHYCTDHLGSTRLVLDDTAHIAERLMFLPTGEVFRDKQISTLYHSDFLFSGKGLDAETGNYYYGARYLAPRLGIWLSPDRYSIKYPYSSAYSYCLGNPIRLMDINGDTISVMNKMSQFLFALDDGSSKMSKMSVRQLYKKGVQWFAPTADNYMPLLYMNKYISKMDGIKHFSWNDIVAFAEIDRSPLAYWERMPGDWKRSSKGGAGYYMVTVDGYPYWSDAIGQIPFTLNTFRDGLRYTANYQYSVEQTVKIGKSFQHGFFDPFHPDNSNSYDNEMIKRALIWAVKRYDIVGVNEWNKNFNLKNTGYSPSLLSRPIQ